MDVDAGRRKISKLVADLKAAETSGNLANVRLLKARIENMRERIKKWEEEEKEKTGWFCDGCKRILGPGAQRYDCMECPDEFTFCKTCFLTKDHLHRLHSTTNTIHLSVSREKDESDYTLQHATM